MEKILEKAYIQWRYVNTKENPADLGSRGSKVDESKQLWLKVQSGCPNLCYRGGREEFVR